MASRTKKAVYNTGCELLLELVTAICSFILPRLILSRFGSTYNGLISSISQFIGCIALLKSGIGSVTRAALYKPLAEGNTVQISKIVNATASFMKKIAIFFAIGILLFSVFYPFIVISDFNWSSSFFLVIILSISTFAQYYFGLTYQMVLEADQKNYIISVINILTTITNTIFASLLILSGFGIHFVKLASAFVFIIPPVFYNIYVVKKYNINKKVEPDYSLIGERWDAFGHQIANFINTNTDIIVATIFLGVKEVSVYSIYYMIGNAIKKGIKAISTGTTAAFGNMLAKNQNELLERRFNQYETLIYYLSTVLVTVTIIMIVPFVKIYTSGITDVNYERPLFGALLCIAIYFESIRLPYQQLVYAAGEFRKTRNGSFAEAAINIVFSIILVNIIGLSGIIVGTIVALSFRTIQFSYFVGKNIIPRSIFFMMKKMIYSIITFLVSLIAASKFPINSISTVGEWIFWAWMISIIVTSLGFVLCFALFKEDVKGLIQVIIQLVKKKKA